MVKGINKLQACSIIGFKYMKLGYMIILNSNRSSIRENRKYKMNNVEQNDKCTGLNR